MKKVSDVTVNDLIKTIKPRQYPKVATKKQLENACKIAKENETSNFHINK